MTAKSQFSAFSPEPRRKSRHLYQIALALGSFFFACSLGIGCESPPAEPDSCIGGVIKDGKCEGKCVPSLCLDQNTCVGNRCLLECGGHLECYANGVQSCSPAKEDDTGDDILVCQPSGKPAGIGAPCVAGNECASWLRCPDGGDCKAEQCGGDAAACVPDPDACKDAAACTAGKCPDGSACRVDCAKDCAPWLECESVAEGDADAYCTERDCQADADCLPGYYCGIVRTRYGICGPACKDDGGMKQCAGGERDGEPCEDDKFCQKGNDGICGETMESCKAPGEGGATFFEGSQCLLRRSCLKRGPAVACASDVDCSRVEGQKCALLGGERRCAKGCSADSDCPSDSRCDSAQGSCLPRFGAWLGKGGFCEPCISDEDCGKVGSTAACAVLPANGKACFDYAYPAECTADADCPKSPSGLRGACLDEGESYNPGDALYHRCAFPIDPETKNPTCW